MDGQLAPAGARNCLLHAHVRIVRGFRWLGGVGGGDLAAIGAVAAYVRLGFSVQRVALATCDAAFNFEAARGSSCAS